MRSSYKEEQTSFSVAKRSSLFFLSFLCSIERKFEEPLEMKLLYIR